MADENNAKDLWAVELLSDCVVIVNNHEKAKILGQLKNAIDMDKIGLITGIDYQGYEFGFRADSIVMWHNVAPAIKDVIDARENP
jgi:hypothetical protein